MPSLPDPPPTPVRIMPAPEPASARRWRRVRAGMVIFCIAVLMFVYYGFWQGWWW